MLKRSLKAASKFQKVAESTLFKQQALSIALRNAQKFPNFSSFPKYNHKVMTLNSFTRQNFACKCILIKSLNNKALPSHSKLAMPALSPTMEQVTSFSFIY